MSLKGFGLWALGFGIALLATSVHGSQNLAIKKINLPRFPASTISRSLLPHRDAPLRVAALRVEFVRDSLSTTTGAGAFRYAEVDSFYTETPPDTIYFDPPPHDSRYFADHIEFQNFYWNKMSAGNVNLTCDVFPAGSHAAYKLPKQMWQYNYNNGAAQLDRGLAELFRDAIQAADADPAVVWNNYDLVIIFHAGAGAEFDLGFSSTPHDLPSAWMVKEDFRSQLNLPNGIPVDNETGSVSSGLILPETESHEGVQISMAGVISLMIGHWMGLPALYDKDEGNPVVGKWSMMDRGFGNFYGALPGPVDVWSASHMGWITIPEVATGSNQIYTRFYDGPEVPPFTPRAYRIPVSGQEEFIIECRYRGADTDTVAYAWDRDGRRMTFNDDYSVTVESGFRVPVRADNLDFDSPGSGILIWHHDGGLDGLIDQGRFNSVDEVRGLDLEEADGAQDIGRDYPFLTPGYGTDYGIPDDAWYGNNKAYADANKGREVSFNDDSYPNSRSNSGAFTHVRVDSISRRGAKMGFRFKQSYLQGDFSDLDPLSIDWVGSGNFYGDETEEVIVVDQSDTIRFFDGTGRQLEVIRLVPGGSVSNNSGAIIGDLNNDQFDDVALGLYAPNVGFRLVVLESSPRGFQIRDLGLMNDGDTGQGSLSIYGPPDDRKLTVIQYELMPLDSSQAAIWTYDRDLNLIFDTTITGRYFIRQSSILGSQISDTLLVTFNDYRYSIERLFILTKQGIIDTVSFSTLDIIGPLCDWDGSGSQDLLVKQRFNLNIGLISDPGLNGLDSVLIDWKFAESSLFRDTIPHGLIPLDYDNDGKFELLGQLGIDIIISDNRGILLTKHITSILLTSPVKSFDFATEDFIRIADLEGDGIPEIFFFVLSGRAGHNGYFYSLIGLDTQGNAVPGTPIELESYPDEIILTQIDADSNIEVICQMGTSCRIYDLPASNPTIWWGNQYRDKSRSNAIWEPATPFSPAPGAKLMPDDLCYNWPNPARGETTAIRYTLNFPATVSVEIFDIAGNKVASLSGPGEAGVPNEIVWNVKNVARGAYLAVVEASGSGKTERKTVKIAVVK